MSYKIASTSSFNKYFGSDITLDGGDITNGNVALDIGEAYSTGSLFSEATDNSYFDIYCADSGGNDLCEFKSGIYNNGGTFYNQNALIQRAYIQDDDSDLQINDNLDVYGGYLLDSNSELLLNHKTLECLCEFWDA